VGYEHAWNSNTGYTNAVLLKIQRHSDHHVNTLKRYETLIHYDDTPQLPAGYALMMMLSWFPQVFFSIMNPLVDKQNEKSKRQKNTISVS